MKPSQLWKPYIEPSLMQSALCCSIDILPKSSLILSKFPVSPSYAVISPSFCHCFASFFHHFTITTSSSNALQGICCWLSFYSKAEGDYTLTDI
ncbi:hypothetical protein AB3S75_034741 [Citrus x aurantiifolia]